ncbi:MULTISPECIES: hypothetical protein [Streptomyces]|uniref:Uncharacterized protein n=1 Tax=Streptomyces griseus subsp. griseus (strain JCM 4626 / CBS 651.72 / NBRC 13350 / KCC S-0626 / ISP 5235) TaxID=455632 RepID=B1VWC3_STRGG|nr:hypothetical protein [Streptomyces griseus]MYR11875.1 hypothetical protein [Streptomyces sp. SID724]MBW3703894.1 hypothetical protein [Streptomyces griseus]NEB57510.1 hypothetical protein [Streptomyces griseus]SED53952.1 hypothetical protein SAMN04490359_0837 [Streptomyces griseus]SQA22374.1 Uncharacterised protein [Streptomyces griseus]
MGFFDKLTGTKHPEAGLAPCPAEELRAALLGLNRPDVPYVISDGSAQGADLVAQWRIDEPAWQTFFIGSQLTHAIRIRMRLAEDVPEVRAVEESWEVTRVGNPPRLQTSAEYGRGGGRTVSRRYTFQRGESGRLEATESFSFDSAQLTDPLRETALTSGWTWRGVVFGKL